MQCSDWTILEYDNETHPSKPLSPLAPSKTAPGKPGIPWSPENRKGVLEFY
jgi:hypothetical protein